MFLGSGFETSKVLSKNLGIHLEKSALIAGRDAQIVAM